MKRLIFSGLAIMTALISAAAPITPDEALQRLGNGSSRLPSVSFRNPELKMTVATPRGDNALYVFDRSDKKGYFILSADNSVRLLLGYSENGDFDENNIPPALDYWLKEYARQISYIKDINADLVEFDEDSYLAGLPEWDPIEPLVKTKWNQDAPFYNECPMIGNRHCYTGCVATSMAQVMKYFEYPAKGTGYITYKPLNFTDKLSMFFSIEFDWDNMLDVYQRGEYNEDQSKAVALLMKAAGYSVQMNYSTETSGAVSSMIGDAMINYFDYDKGARYEDRSNYDYNEWAQMVYDNINKIGPIIYDGTAPLSGGHSFLCDGYDTDGYFHFNWGWGGMSDGYFTLDVLNPGSIGIGGYSGGFNFDQDAWFGIQPNTGESVAEQNGYSQYGSTYGTIENRNAGPTIVFSIIMGGNTPGWKYTGTGSTYYTMGIQVENMDTEEVQDYYELDGYVYLPVSPIGYYPCDPASFPLPALALNPLKLQDGVPYKFTMSFRNDGVISKPWNPVSVSEGMYNYVIVTKNGDSYEVENMKPKCFTTSDLSLESSLYYGCPVKAKATISNESDIQLSRGVCIVLLDDSDRMAFMGDSFFLTLDPGETIDKDWVSIMSVYQGTQIYEPTEFRVGLYDIETSYFYQINEEKVVMEPNPGTPSLTANVSIENYEIEKGIYKVTDSSDIEVKIDLNLSRGYFGYPVTVYIMQEVETSTGTTLSALVSQTFDEIPFMEDSGTTTLKTTLNFTNPVPNEEYTILSAYSNGGRTVWLNRYNPVLFMVEGAGVESVAASKGIRFYHDKAANNLTAFTPNGLETARAYMLNGVEVPLNVENFGDYAVISLDRLNKGIVIIAVTDKSGNMSTVKLAL